MVLTLMSTNLRRKKHRAGDCVKCFSVTLAVFYCVCVRVCLFRDLCLQMCPGGGDLQHAAGGDAQPQHQCGGGGCAGAKPPGCTHTAHSCRYTHTLTPYVFGGLLFFYMMSGNDRITQYIKISVTENKMHPFNSLVPETRSPLHLFTAL